MAAEADPLPLFGVTVTGSDTPIICAGEVDLASAPYLRDAIVAAIGTDEGAVIVDLADVTFMDSTGVGVLVWSTDGSKARAGNYGCTHPAGG